MCDPQSLLQQDGNTSVSQLFKSQYLARVSLSLAAGYERLILFLGLSKGRGCQRCPCNGKARQLVQMALDKIIYLFIYLSESTLFLL